MTDRSLSSVTVHMTLLTTGVCFQAYAMTTITKWVLLKRGTENGTK